MGKNNKEKTKVEHYIRCRYCGKFEESWFTGTGGMCKECKAKVDKLEVKDET
jgi:DNA-directed RNA polymerase subunit RPC12/RpoP